MRLESPWVLLLLGFLPVLYRFLKRRATPAAANFPLEIPATARRRNPIPFLIALKYVGWSLLILALARPQASHRSTERIVSGVDVMMVMDVSASMMAEDMADRSRLKIAKEVMEKFIRGRNNDRIGFVVFSGEPLALTPPTLDYELLIKAVREAETGVLRDGTAIGDGLALAVNRLKESKAKSRVIVLLTDGDSNVGQVGPADAGEMAKGFGIKVYTIAIGREGRIRIPITRKNIFGNSTTNYIYQENALNTELLQLIAKLTQGRFYRVQDLETLQSVFDEIDQLEKTEIQAKERIQYEELFHLPLRGGALALALEQLLARVWWGILP